MGEIGPRRDLRDLRILTADNSRYEKVEDTHCRYPGGSIEKTGGKFVAEIPDRERAIRYKDCQCPARG